MAEKKAEKKKELSDAQKAFARAVFEGASHTRPWGDPPLSGDEMREVLESDAVEAVGRE